MNEHDIRKAIIDDPDGMKYLLLTWHSATLMRFIIKSGEMTTAKLSNKRNISVQNASRQLYALFNKGYLKRKEVVSDSGGIEYIYKSVV